MTITMRKTYRMLGREVRDTLREELQGVRATEGCLTKPRVAALAAELQVAERTVWRLAETHDAEGRCPSRGLFTLGPVHQRAIAASPNLKAAWRELRDNGVPVPSYVQWTRAVKSADPAVIDGLRYGREALHEKQTYLLIEAGARNETWSIDHYYVPVQVRWPGYANPVTPVQTTLMDEKTRIVLATVLWPKPPTAEQALSVVAKAMHGHTTDDGTFVGGRPGTLRMDNGTELIGEVMNEGLINLGVTATPARARGAWEKGKLERWHRTLGAECWSLEAGWTGGPRNYAGQPILTVAQNGLPDDVTPAQAKEMMRIRSEQERTVTNLTGSARELRTRRSADRAAADQAKAEESAAAAAEAAELAAPSEEVDADDTPVAAPAAPEPSPSTPAGDRARRKRAGLTLPLADDPLGANGVGTNALLARRPRQARRTPRETR